MTSIEKFYIENKIVVITGGAGLLGKKHAEAVIEGKGIPVLIDISAQALDAAKKQLIDTYGKNCSVECYTADITKSQRIKEISDDLIKKYEHIDVLINNAANNPKVEGKAANMKAIQFENFPMQMWIDDIAVGLTGAFVCAQIFGEVMARQGDGNILNISSDLGIIAPDQRIYRKEELSAEEQPVKPVTYSVIKHGLIGLTKYLATYYAEKGIRANTLCPSGVFNGQNEEFLDKLTNLIPMGRMANINEYKSTILYLISDASSYMTGSTVIVDGGRTCW
ncbi:NAD-dependent glycerol dehydrogenase [Lachnospiraceae bacterium]|nr:NAD-dependent glycerol dehydrogenase [Lachnospiraceae bacterium]